MSAVAVALMALPGGRRPRVRWLTRAGLAALLAACAYDVAVLLPYTPFATPAVPAAAACPADRRLRLLAANVQASNRHDARLLDIVRDADPDVAWFQETDGWWEQALAPLAQAMPHAVAQAQPGYFGVHLFSKLPLAGPEVHDITGPRTPSVVTGLVLPSGRTVRLYAIHPQPPKLGQDTVERDAELLAAALAARDDPAPHVIAGDFNAVPWERALRLMQRVGPFRDPRVGRGLHVTWDAHSAVLRWPLDHVLLGPGFSLRAFRVLPAFGSDHYPLLAEACLDPDPAAPPQPSTLRPGDLETARQAVRAGRRNDAAGPNPR